MNKRTGFTAFLFMLCALTLPAQRNNTDGTDDDGHPVFVVGDQDSAYGRAGVLFEAGITNFHPWKLNNLFAAQPGFTQLTNVGFGFNYSTETSYDSTDTYYGNDQTYSMHWFLGEDQEGVAANGDRIRYHLKGWELMTSSICMNLIANEHVDLVLGVGAYWGTLKLSTENATEPSGEMRYTNPFVAPMFRSELRFNLGWFSVGGRFSGRYDITDPKWKRKTNGADSLPGYQFRALQLEFYIGFRGTTE